MNDVSGRSKAGSPLAFDWGDGGFMDPKAKIDVLDPFLESNEGSLASDDHLDFADGPKSVGISLSGDLPKPRTITTDSRKRSANSSNSLYSDSGGTVSRRRKKPKGMPKRPLSAYNLYFQSERAKILATAEGEGQKIGFEGLGKIIGRKWRDLPPGDRKAYERLAEKDSERYRQEMEAYNELKAKKLEDEERASSSRFSASLEGGTQVRPYEAHSGYHQRSSLTSQPESFAVSTGAPIMPGDAREEFSRLHAIPAPAAGAHFGHTQMPFSGMQLPDSMPAYSPQFDVGASHGPPPTSTIRHQFSLPPPPPGAEPMPSSKTFPMPPGMELVLSDRTGQDRKYRVQYTCYSMTRDAAHKYIESLTGAPPGDSTNTGTYFAYPTPNAPAQPVPMPPG